MDRLVRYQIYSVVITLLNEGLLGAEQSLPNSEFADVSNPEGKLILTICRNSQQRDNKARWGGALWKLNKSQLEKISRLGN